MDLVTNIFRIRQFSGGVTCHVLHILGTSWKRGPDIRLVIRENVFSCKNLNSIRICGLCPLPPKHFKSWSDYDGGISKLWKTAAAVVVEKCASKKPGGTVRHCPASVHVRIFKHSATGDSITLSYIVAAWLMTSTRLFCSVEEFCDNAVIYFIAPSSPLVWLHVAACPLPSLSRAAFMSSRWILVNKPSLYFPDMLLL